MGPNRIIIILGTTLIILWATSIPIDLFPLPFPEHKGSENLAKDIYNAPEFLKERTGIKGFSEEMISKLLTRYYQVNWIKNLIFIFLGIVSGVLILRKNNTGRLLALGLSFYMIFMNLISFIKYPRSFANWLIQQKLTFKYWPTEAVYGLIFKTVMLSVIVVLFWPSVAKEFRKIPEKPA